MSADHDRYTLTTRDDEPIRAEVTDLAVGAIRRVTLRPRHGWQAIDLRELGVAWAILQPFCTMVAFTIIAGLGNLSTDNTPKPLFYFCGLLPWLLFGNSLNNTGNNLVANQYEDERRAVARAGQERTLRDHTYQLRMRELAQIVREHQA